MITRKVSRSRRVLSFVLSAFLVFQGLPVQAMEGTSEGATIPVLESLDEPSLTVDGSGGLNENSVDSDGMDIDFDVSMDDGDGSTSMMDEVDEEDLMDEVDPEDEDNISDGEGPTDEVDPEDENEPEEENIDVVAEDVKDDEEVITEVTDESLAATLAEKDAAVEALEGEKPAGESMGLTAQASSNGTFATAYEAYEYDFFGRVFTDYFNKDYRTSVYKFTLANAGKATFKLQSLQPASGGLGTGVTLEVFNYYNTYSYVWSEYYGTNSINAISESASVFLTKGTYYLRLSISSYGAPEKTGQCNLTPTFTSAQESFVESQGGSNNTTSSASGPLAYNTTYRGQLAKNDDKDYYRFVVSKPGRVVFTFGGIGNNLYKNLYTTSGKIQRGFFSLSDTRYYADLSVGTYYLELFNYSATGNYTVKLTYTAAKESFPETTTYGGRDNSTRSANQVKFNKVYYGQLSATDDYDYYKFYVGSNRNVSLTSGNVSKYLGDTLVSICDEYGEFDETMQFREAANATVPYANHTYYLYFHTANLRPDTGVYYFRLYNGVMHDLSETSISAPACKYYTGKAIKVKPKLKLNGRTLVLGRDYKLKYKNNKKAGKATIIATGMNGFRGNKKKSFKIIRPSVKYATWIQGKGYKQGWKANGKIAGTTGQKRYIRYLKCKLTGVRPSGGIKYQVNTTHVPGAYWDANWHQGWVSDGSEGGNDKQKIEAVQISLYGQMKKYYDIYYRVHAQGYGWMGWAKNGRSAGSWERNRRIEAIQIVLVKKGKKAPPANYKNAKRKTKARYVS